MRSFSAIVPLFAVFVWSCGITNTIEGTSWEAKLDSLPSADCVKGVLAATPEIKLVEYRHEDISHLFGKADHWDRYFLKLTAVQFAGPADMGLHIGEEHLQGIRFALHYGHWRNYEAVSDAAARSVIARISAGCGVPELQLRVRRNDHSDWVPYLFNV